MDKNPKHAIKELQQVNLLLNKIAEKIETKSSEHKINELEQVNVLAKKILNNPPPDTKISPIVLEKIHNDLKTPLTPVKAYVQLLLSDNFGKMTDSQKEKMRSISENLDELESAIQRLF